MHSPIAKFIADYHSRLGLLILQRKLSPQAVTQLLDYLIAAMASHLCRSRHLMVNKISRMTESLWDQLSTSMVVLIWIETIMTGLERDANIAQ